MVGDWEGTYLLWLRPDELTSESPTHAAVRPVLGGRFVGYDYEWAVNGEPQQGSMLVGCTAAGVLQAAWVDTWHNGDDIMFCASSAAVASVSGEYGPPEERWRWRTEYLMPSDDDLVITAWNIMPDGREGRATEATYRRSG